MRAALTAFLWAEGLTEEAEDEWSQLCQSGGRVGMQKMQAIEQENSIPSIALLPLVAFGKLANAVTGQPKVPVRKSCLSMLIGSFYDPAIAEL